MTPIPSMNRRRHFLAALLLVGGSLAAYWPSLAGQFLFDDVSLVTNSPLVKAGDGLYRMWLTTQAVDYWPMTNSSFWVEWRLWGTNPVGYHVANLALHVASAFLLWAILRRLAIPGAFLGALIFALHPVNVESVAWIAQRKNTLSMTFLLLSIFWFAGADSEGAQEREHAVGARSRSPALQTPRRTRSRAGRTTTTRGEPIGPWYWLSFSAFMLAMLSKGSVAVLPGLLLLIAWWRHGTLTSRDLWRSLPFWGVAVALTLVNIWFQADKLVEPIRQASALERLLGAGAIVWFYLHKALLPINLAFVYPQWQIRVDAFQWWLPLAAAVGTTAFLWNQRRRPVGRAAFAAWLFFCFALVPVMGFTDVYFMKYSLVADHYQYIAVLVVAAGVAAALDRLKDRRIAVSAASVLLLLLATGTWRQSHLYAGDETLYRGTLKANPSAWMAQNNLGAILLNRGDNKEALLHVQEALRLKAVYPAAQSNLCHILVNLRRMDAAIAPCALALRFNPGDPLLHNSLGSALASLGQLDDAKIEFERALQLKNDFADAHYKLAGVLEAKGQDEAAVGHYRDVLRLTPDSVMAHTGLGNALMNLGHAQDAEAHFRIAIKLKPEFAEAHCDLGDLLLAAGRLEDAIVEYTAALQYDPRSVDAHNNLGVVLVRRGQTDEAIRHFHAALTIQPDSADARTNLAAVLRRRSPVKK